MPPAQVVIAKVLAHLPLQRQQKIYARERGQLSGNTLTNWFGQSAVVVLSPLQILDTRKGKSGKDTCEHT